MQTIFLWTFIARKISQDQSKEHSLGNVGMLEQASPTGQARKDPIRMTSIKLSDDKVTMIKEVFDLFNTDGQGGLEEDELASAIFAMGFSTSGHHKLAKELMGQISDGSSVSLEQFTELMRGHLAGRDPEEEIRSTFTCICEKEKGERAKIIDMELLRAKVRRLHIKLSDEELRDMIADADRSGKGGVGLEEYMQILKQSTWM